MYRTIASIFITFALLLGLSVYETKKIDSAFDDLLSAVEILQEKAETNVISYDDGLAVRSLWEKKKKFLHIFLPHTSLQEVDYQLNEAIGFLRQKDTDGALPKVEVVLNLLHTLPRAYKVRLENIL